MPSRLTVPLSPDDAAFLAAFHRETGLDPTTVGTIAIQAMIAHLRIHGQITLPLMISPTDPKPASKILRFHAESCTE